MRPGEIPLMFDAMRADGDSGGLAPGNLRVLVVEDSEDDAVLLIHEVRRGGYDLFWKRVDTPAALKAALADETWDVLLVDYNLPGFNALRALDLLKESRFDIPFIVVSGSVGEEVAVEAMRAGAHDYVMKANLTRLLPAIERELREAKEREMRRRDGETIRKLAYYDPVTGLPNRASVRSRLHREILAGTAGTQLALLLLDLDRFKEINDTLGHHRGDVLLQQVGRRLLEALGGGGTLAHMGADEFAMVLPGAGREASEEVARRIQRAMEEPFVLEGLLLDVGMSIGIALFPVHGSEVDLLLRRADVAMYWAKAGHQGWAVYAPEKDEYSPQRLTLLGEFRHALEQDDQLFLAYQPKVDLRARRIIGVEALARWQHPQQGLLEPKRFIPLIERTALIRPFTLRVLKMALVQCRAWRDAGLPLTAAVNLSARNLEDTQLENQISGLLRTHGVPPEALQLEVTESAIMTDPTYAIGLLDRLSGLGLSLSIDDFGTGYSSLEYLKRLPVDTIKIDQSFVIGMAVDPDAAMIVRSTVNLAHDLGLRVVAEGVENQETLDSLVALSCDEAQGYHLSRPLLPDALATWVDASPWGLRRSGVGSH